MSRSFARTHALIICTRFCIQPVWRNSRVQASYEEENPRWKALVADLSLDREAGESPHGRFGPPGVKKIAAWQVRSLGVAADEGSLIFS